MNAHVELLAQDDSGGGGSSAGIALVLLIAIVLVAVRAFRSATRSNEADDAAATDDLDAPFVAPGGLKIAAWSLVGASLLGLVLPVLSSNFGNSGRLSEAGGETILYFVLAWGTLLVGGVAKASRPQGTAIAQGAAVAFGGYLVFIASAFWAVVYISDGLFTAGAGVVFLSISAAVAIWVIALRKLPGVVTSSRTVSGWSITLLLGGCLTALGVMLPPNDSGRSFKEVNFEWDPAVMQVTWLVFVASFLLPGVLAFRDRTQVGLGLAAGALVATVWLALATIIESEGSTDVASPAFSESHPLFIVGALLQLVAVLVGYSMLRTRDAAPAAAPAAAPVGEPVTRPSPSSVPPPPPPPATPPAAATPPTSPTAAPRPSNDEPVGYDSGTWSTEQFRAIRERLQERGVRYEVIDGRLTVSPAAQAVTEMIVAEVVTATP